MKKILIALLALVLCLSFVACDGNPAVSTDDNDTTVVDGGDNTTPTVTTPAETTEPEVVDSDTLAVGEDNNTEFGPIQQ